MINYRDENIKFLVEESEKEGVTMLDAIESFDYWEICLYLGY